MADWLSSLRSAGARTSTKPFARSNNSACVPARQTPLHDEPSAVSTATKDDVTDSSDSRTTSRNSSKLKSGDLDSRFPKTPRRKGLIQVRQASSNQRNQHDQTKESTSPPGSPRASSVKSADDASIMTDDEFSADSEGDCVQVCVRVRPVNDKEQRDSSHQHCIHVIGTRTLKLFMQKNRSEPHIFHYDNVFTEESSQKEVFELAGYPVVENCLNGYNSTIFAYGQTGAGKTFTMLGHLGGLNEKQSDMRGLAPRVFEYLFERIAASEDSKGRENIKYSCRCSFLEIYNETITDLLHPAATNLQIREDIKKGCYVDGLSEESVVNVEEMLALMKRGADNRHVGETRMNRESSRSHSVFTLTLERCSKSSNGLTNIVFSRLNLIDLAGSERQKKSEVAGSHLKEACHINKSLTILGRVIHELVEAQRSGRKSHVPYRDSRLTFLLQDSLGGNAKTWIIANVSPSSCCSQETLSTLQFAQRAKRIRNRAVVNMDTRGDVAVLQKEIARLNQEIHNLRGGVTDAYVTENAQLRAQLKEQERLHHEVQMKCETVQTEVQRYKRERDRAEGKMQQFTTSQGQLLLAVSRMELAMKACQAEAAAASQKEVEVLQQANRVLEAERDGLMTQVAELEAVGADFQLQLSTAVGKQAQLQQLLEKEKASCKDLHSMTATLQQQNARLLADLQDECSKVVAGQSTIGQVEEHLATLQQKYRANESELATVREELASEKDARDQLAVSVQALEAQLSAQHMELSAAFSSMKSLRSELERSNAELETARAQLDSEKAAGGQLEGSLKAVSDQLHTATEELFSTRSALESEQVTATNLRKELEALQSKLGDAHAEIGSGKEAMQALQTELASVRHQLTDTASAYAAIQEELSQEQLAKADLQGKLRELEQQLSAERKASADHEAGAESACRKVAELEQEVQMLQNQLEQQHQKHVDLQTEAQALSEDLKDQLSKVSEQCAQAQSQLEDEAQARRQSEEVVAKLTQELESLKQLLTTEQAQAHDAEEQLKEQASSLAAELAQTEVHLAAERQAKEQVLEKAAELTEELDALKQLSAEQQTAADELGMQLGALRQHKAELEEQVRKLSQTELKLYAELKSMTEECAGQHALVEKLTQERSDLEQAKELLQQDMAAQQSQLQAAQEKASNLSEQLQRLESNARHQAEEMQQILSNVKQEYEETVAKHAATIRSRMEDARQAEERHQQSRAELQSQLEAAQEHANVLSQEKGDLLATLDDKLERLALLQQENTGLKEQLLTMQDLVEEGDTQLKAAREQISVTMAQVQEAQDKADAAAKERNARDQELQTLRRTAEHAAATAMQTQRQQQTQIEALQQDLSKAVENLARQEQEMKQQVHSLTAKLENSKHEAASLQNALSEEQVEIKHLKASLAKVKATCDEAQKLNVTLEKRVKELEEHKSKLIANTDTQIRRLSNEMHGLQQQLASAHDRLEASYKANTSEAVKVARFAHAFQEMRRLIETAHITDGSSPAGLVAAENSPPVSSIRSGSFRPGHVLAMSPIKQHSSPLRGVDKEAELAGLRDQLRTPQAKIAQQLRESLDGLAALLPRQPVDRGN